MFPKRDSDGIAFGERPKSSAIAGMAGFRHDLPTLVQHACQVLVHCLHAREQPLSVVLPGPISLVRKRLHFHLATASAFFLALFPFRKIARRASLEGTKSLLYCRRINSEAQADVTQGPEARNLQCGALAGACRNRRLQAFQECYG